MIAEDLDKKFKDAKDPFRIVFVCAMWMTGFDVPSCSTIYLDKPMRNHTLMQTIARANRVYADKMAGLIVDYIGVFRNLQKALAIYGTASGGGVREGEMPVQDKNRLVDALRTSIKNAASFLRERAVDIRKIQAASGFRRVKFLDDAVEAVIVNDETKRKYLGMASEVAALFKAILPDPRANEFTADKAVIVIIAEKIRLLTPEADIEEAIGAVENLLDSSVAAEGYVIHQPLEGDKDRILDLSKIDFESLKAKFEKSRKRIEAEKLRTSIDKKLQQLIRLNHSRVDYLEKFKKMIEEYNSGASNVEVYFDRLVEFAQDLTEEEKRTITENLSEEELAVFDLLAKPDIGLSQKERNQLKKAARDLLNILKAEKLVLDWRKRQQSRAQVKVTIEDILDKELPGKFTRDIYKQKCEVVYQHIYDSYFGKNQNIYQGVAG
jgi:type I restriction enzyme R subunit